MKIMTILKGGLMERRDIRSGRIYQKGSDPQYGVIYSCKMDKSDNDLGLDSADFKDAWIGPVSAPESDKDQFFTILGAYYYQDNHPDKPKTTKVFGVAKSEFAVTEGGSTDLHDAGWILQDPEKPSLDESLWSKTHGKHHGWTFIVDLKERNQYPKSEQELKIFKKEEEVEPPVKFKCPELTGLESVKTKGDDKTSSFNFTARVRGENPPEKYEWDWGDGHRDTTSKPTLTHDYKMPGPGATATYTVKVTAVGPKDCRGKGETQITLTAEKPPVEPPPPPNGGPPKICTYLPLIVAFFMALTFCTILIAWVVDLRDQAEESGWLVPTIFFFAVLALGCIFFWFKKGCPKGKKQWMGILSVVFLAGFLVCLYISGCVEAWFWVINILVLGLAVFCLYMYRKCSATTMELILTVVVCLLAFCVAGLLIAPRVLDCC